MWLTILSRQRLENNWRSGQFSLGTCSHHVDVQSILFRMDNENIVYDAEGTIKVLDRKTLQVKTVKMKLIPSKWENLNSASVFRLFSTVNSLNFL